MRPLHWAPTMQDFCRKLDGLPLFRIAVLKCPGTWADPDTGFQADLVRGLNPHAFSGIDNHYGQWFGPVKGPLGAPSYIETVHEGVASGVQALSDLDAQFVIAGFSKGAQVAYELTREFLPGGRLAHRERDLLAVITFGDPCRFSGTVDVGHHPPGGGIARRPPLPAHLASRYITFALDDDMYCTADPEQDYLWIGYAALAGDYDRPGSGLQLHDPMALATAMLELIRRDEFVDALVELLPPDFTGLRTVVHELTGLSSDRLLANRSPVRGGLLGALLSDPSATLASLVPLARSLAPLAGGLLPDRPGSGTGGTPQGWAKMIRTVAKLIAFARSNDHMNYAAPHRAVYGGKTAVQWAVDWLNHRGGQLL